MFLLLHKPHWTSGYLSESTECSCFFPSLIGALAVFCWLQNLCLELATMGDLKLVERPQNYTLAAGQSKVVRANIKVGADFLLDILTLV
jgi:hypothetical protein